MALVKNFFRVNHIRNHYLKFGLSGIVFYFKTIFGSKNKYIIFKNCKYLHPIYLRNNSSDIPTFYQIIFNLDYDIKPISQPQIIIDLGANIGLSSVYFLNKYPEAKVFAVEPESSNYAMLLKNTKGYSNLIPLNKGVWNKKTHLEIVDNDLGNWGFSVKEVAVKSNNSIETISINEIIEEYKISQIDILKIDIEGSEIELFMSNFETWLPTTKMMIIELHDWMRKGCSKQFFTTLVNYNFSLSHKGENLIIYIENE